MDCGQSRRICGTIVAGYEDVLEAFKTHVIDGIEIGSQVCCYVKGLKVYDLYSTKEETDGLSIGYRQYGADSIQNLFSTSKVLTSLVVAMLADRGHLQYEQPVASLWPEYAQHGKSATTIAQVMRHEAGLPSLDQPLHAADLMTSRIKEGSVSELIAAQKPSYIPGEKRQYHAISRGWIANEIVRRADPQGRTIGEFLRDEVAAPLDLQEELCLGVLRRYRRR